LDIESNGHLPLSAWSKLMCDIICRLFDEILVITELSRKAVWVDHLICQIYHWLHHICSAIFFFLYYQFLDGKLNHDGQADRSDMQVFRCQTHFHISFDNFFFKITFWLCVGLISGLSGTFVRKKVSEELKHKWFKFSLIFSAVHPYFFYVC
jgi:hypothetical protein